MSQKSDFENALIRNGKQVEILFFLDLDKCLEDLQTNFQPSTTFTCADLWQKYAFLREFFSTIFDKNAYFRHKSALENGRRLGKNGGPPTIYLSRVKKSSLYLLVVTNVSVLKSAPLHITTYFRRK